MQKLAIKTVGTLVMINNRMPVVANPVSNVVTKHNRKQFWFFYRGDYILAVQTAKGWNARH